MRTTFLVWIALLVVLLSGAVVQAQDQPNIDDYQVLLVPVFFFGPGAHGSQWETSVSLTSTSTAWASMPVAMLADPSDPNDDHCGTPTELIEDNHRYFLCSGYASPSGLLLYVPRTILANEIHVNARVRDLTRAASSAGTEIPVVPESQFTSQDILLTDIPSDARFRANLRIYGGTMAFNPELRFIHPGGTVILDIHDSRDLDSSLVHTVLHLSAPETVFGSSHFVRPAYFSIGDLVAAYPQLATVPSYTIRIRTAQPLTSPVVELSTWAFVTITNNETQEVTTVSP